MTENEITSIPTPPLRVAGVRVRLSVDDKVYQLGAWLAGLSSFLAGSGLTYGDRGSIRPYNDHIRELRVARGALQRCSSLAFHILAASESEDEASDLARAGMSFEELREFTGALRDVLLLTDSLNRAESMTLTEWQAWCKVFAERFSDVSAFEKLTTQVDIGGEQFLPEKLISLVKHGQGTIRSEFETILPRFGRILRLLNIVGEMLASDEPLKPALLIFSKVSEQIQELIAYLNNRIERSRGADDDFISSIDGAAYTVSIELKKVINQELAGMTSIRPSTTVYARTESAYALLTESFQHILTGFAKQFDQKIDSFELFPNFGEKLERSLKLRNELYAILLLVQKAEHDPETKNTAELNKALLRYMDEALGFLFYKDTETFERFVEEILVTRQKKDLVPILHRFGAYLETLFAQVNMRSVLEKYPFQHIKS